jgi:hypothetical protein
MLNHIQDPENKFEQTLVHLFEIVEVKIFEMVKNLELHDEKIIEYQLIIYAHHITRVSSPCSDTTPPQPRVHRRTTAPPSQPKCIIGTIVGTDTSPESIANFTSTNATSSTRSRNTVSTSTTTTSRVKKSNQAAQDAQSRKEKELVQTTVTQMCRDYAKKKKQQGKQKKEESSGDDDDLSEVIYVASSSSGKAKKKKAIDDQYIECIGSTSPPSYPRSFYTPTMSDTTQSKQSRNVKRMSDIMAGVCNHCQNVICHDQEYGGFNNSNTDNKIDESQHNSQDDHFLDSEFGLQT